MKYQENALCDFIQFAVENSPFYRDLYKGIDIANIKSVIRAQFRQSKFDTIDALLEVDRTKWNDEQEKFLLNEFSHKLGFDMNVNIQIVNEIPRESSGKFRMIVNTVDC